MERYSEYKDSGVQWLGEIPSHWEMQRWRFLLAENKQKNSGCKEKIQLQFRYGEIVEKADQGDEKDVLETISNYTVVEKNDIIINGLNLNYDFISQRVAQVQKNGVITSAYTCLHPTYLANSRYYTYFLKSMDFRKMFHGMGTGVRLTLSYNELKNQFIPHPSPNEQQSIAAYLDDVTGKIDKVIAQQQKMIGLLNERKQIIINHAVTKGLNPNVSMKDSGMEWIGQIPEHWEQLPLKYVFEIRNGYTPSKNDKSYWTNGTIPWYRMEDIRKSGHILNESIQYVTHKAVNGKGLFKAGSYIMAICTASIGEHAMLIADSLANQQFANFNIRKSLVEDFDPMYLFYFMYVVGDFCRNNANSTCFQYVDMEALKRFPILKPSKEEQKYIVAYLDKGLKKLNTALEQTKDRIALLQERKQIIINEVVTGKIKVS